MTGPLHIVDPRCTADLRSSPMRVTPPPGCNWVVGFRMGALMARRKTETNEEYLARMRGRYADDPDKYREIGRRNMAKRCSNDPDEVRAYKRDNYAKMSEDPEWVERRNANRLRNYHAGPGRDRQRRQYLERRAAQLDALGHPTHCGVCGLFVEPKRNGDDGRCIDHRHDNDVVRGVVCNGCNHQLSVVDLRFTDPDQWAALLAWSLKGAPAVPTGRKRATVRRHEHHPALFEEDS